MFSEGFGNNKRKKPMKKSGYGKKSMPKKSSGKSCRKKK